MKIRPYTKREMAVMYFPVTPTEKSAVAMLRRFMHNDKELMRLLKDAGYNKRAKIFTAKEVRLLIEHLGEP